MAAFSEPAVEICLLTIDEVFVYKVPPLRTASGHRAEDWGLANPLFTGCLKLFQAGDALRLVIYAFKDPKKTSVTTENIQPFGECPIHVKPGENIIQFVDAVIDSSRYYVVRIKDPKSTRTTMLGIGFRERDDAFDLKNSLNEYVKFINRMDLASQLAAAPLTSEFSDLHLSGGESAFGEVDHPEEYGADGTDGGGYKLASGPAKVDGSGAGWSKIPALKEGEKIKISLTKKTHHSDETTRPSNTTAGSGNGSGVVKSGGLLKPPPPPGSTVHYGGVGPEPATATNISITAITSTTGTNTGTTSTSTTSAAPAAADDEEWGDFN